MRNVIIYGLKVKDKILYYCDSPEECAKCAALDGITDYDIVPEDAQEYESQDEWDLASFNNESWE